MTHYLVLPIGLRQQFEKYETTLFHLFFSFEWSVIKSARLNMHQEIKIILTYFRILFQHVS